MLAKTLLTAVGLVLVLEGVPYFLFPRLTREAAVMAGRLPDRALRALGLAAMLLGLLVVWLAVR